VKEENTRKIKQAALDAEIRVAESILRWRYRKLGKALPHEHALEAQSKQVTDQVHEILARRGKNIWKEIKSLVDKK